MNDYGLTFNSSFQKLSKPHVVTCGKDMKFDELNMDDCLDEDSFFTSNSKSSAGTHISFPLFVRLAIVCHNVIREIWHHFP